MSRVAVVTGGTRGIGLAISRRLQAEDFRVAALYASDTDTAASSAKAHGLDVRRVDVGCPDQSQRAVSEIEAELGPIDVLVNNAGITRDGFFHKMTVDQWQDVIRVNLGSMFNMTRPVIPGMRERKWGRIINISSINGQKGQAGQTNYSAAKAGVIGFTKALAQENARVGVTVNCICPGYVETDMVRAMPEGVLTGIVGQIPAGRLGRPEEIAELVAFLAGEHSGFMTGATLAANGGQYMS